VHHVQSQTGYDQQGDEEFHPSSRRRPGPSESLFLPEVHRRSASAVVIVHRYCATNIGSSLSEINTGARDGIPEAGEELSAIPACQLV
jgi:hypothetical protein